jgi:hypothetical protein
VGNKGGGRGEGVTGRAPAMAREVGGSLVRRGGTRRMAVALGPRKEGWSWPGGLAWGKWPDGLGRAEIQGEKEN